MTRTLSILAAICLGMAIASTAQTRPSSKQVTLTVTDEQAEALRAKLGELSDLTLKQQFDIAIPETVKSITVLPIVEKSVNELRQENLFVEGNQQVKFEGKSVLLGTEWCRVLAAIYDDKTDRTRLVFPIGSKISETKFDELTVME